MASCNPSRRGLKICCGVTAIFLIIVVIISVTLSLTIFKPKQPQVTAHPTSLENIQFTVVPVPSLNITLGMMVSIENQNYGSFKYKNTTAYVNYHGALVAEVPMEHDKVPARGKVNITTSVEIMGDKLISSPYFWDDVAAGCLNLTSMATLHGKVSVLKILKIRATAFSTCEISVFVQSQNIKSNCQSKIKL
ncbi:hypothetical protein L1049_024873 [Liquidambar formosana]|uniref:Late embryogenesis abundant protein LEA-2 subgroup domain-containing protein n=1 Tax=Liquidambar formosana TaxID=63359 RepID=A0AAP0RWS0_LIQFO